MVGHRDHTIKILSSIKTVNIFTTSVNNFFFFPCVIFFACFSLKTSHPSFFPSPLYLFFPLFFPLISFPLLILLFFYSLLPSLLGLSSFNTSQDKSINVSKTAPPAKDRFFISFPPPYRVCDINCLGYINYPAVLLQDETDRA